MDTNGHFHVHGTGNTLQGTVILPFSIHQNTNMEPSRLKKRKNQITVYPFKEKEEKKKNIFHDN